MCRDWCECRNCRNYCNCRAIAMPVQCRMFQWRLKTTIRGTRLTVLRRYEHRPTVVPLRLPFLLPLVTTPDVALLSQARTIYLYTAYCLLTAAYEQPDNPTTRQHDNRIPTIFEPYELPENTVYSQAHHFYSCIVLHFRTVYHSCLWISILLVLLTYYKRAFAHNTHTHTHTLAHTLCYKI